MFPVASTFALALQYHRASQLVQAEQLCRQILQAEPGHADSHHLLGVLAAQSGQTDLAIGSITRALSLNPLVAEYHSNLGLAYQAAGNLKEATTHYREALRLRPNFPEAHTCLGNALHQLGELEDAVAHCREALRTWPEYPPALVNLGSALLDQEKVEEAITCFQSALRMQPNLAEAYNNLGTAFARRERLREAIDCFREAIRLDPSHATAHFNCATALEAQGRFDEALACYEQAIRIQPFHDTTCQEAREAKPTQTGARFNRGLLWLLHGRWLEGWPEYELRWARPGNDCREFPQPRWNGSALNGKRILLHAEQGLGDTIQFIRYVHLVKQRGGRIIFECQPSLLRLLTGIGAVDELLARDAALPVFDLHAPLLSLPGIVGTTLESIPAEVPYLHSEPKLTEQWKHELCDVRHAMCDVRGATSEEKPSALHIPNRTPHFHVGIAWQGQPVYYRDRQRSIPIRQFARLAEVAGVRLVSLQKREKTEQLAKGSAVRGQGSGLGKDEGGRMKDENELEVLHTSFFIPPPYLTPYPLPLTPLLDEESGPFMDTAAIMKSLDLVISSDTAVAHLAGALGVSVWLALPFVPDWRWLLRREDSPWYPSMRLFRQTHAGNWEEVFERMAEELEVLATQ